MNTRRLVCALLGLWMGASLFMGASAVVNFRVVNELLVSPSVEMQGYMKQVGADRMRFLLRHEAAEVNRFLFEAWGVTQIGIGLLLFGVFLFGTKVGKVTLGSSLALVVLVTAMHLVITPGIVGYGRGLDFLAADKEPALRSRVAALHTAYSSLEVVKLLGLATLLGVYLRERPRRRAGMDASEVYAESEVA